MPCACRGLSSSQVQIGAKTNDERHEWSASLHEGVQRLGIASESCLECTRSLASLNPRWLLAQGAIEPGIHQVEIEVGFRVQLVIETSEQHVKSRVVRQAPAEGNNPRVLGKEDEIDLPPQS